MATSNKSQDKNLAFPSMPNFRMVDPLQDAGNGVKKLKLFRSSRPDFLTTAEVEQFRSLGIRCIIDFRSSKEYKKATGSKLLDNYYPVYKVKIPFRLKYKPEDTVRLKRVNVGKPADQIASTSPNKHILLDFFKLNYVWAVFTRAPWYVRLYSMLHLIVDLLLNTGYRYFVRVFARNVLNPMGLTNQYIDILTYSQASICAALKILSDEENLPAMLNCAHGKDRTGIVTAMVLSCLGKNHSFIASDYALSEVELAPIKDRVHAEIVGQFHMSENFTVAKAEHMLGALKYLENNYGSVSEYMTSIGFGLKDQERLKNNLLA